jgi:hypothetical protein
MNSDYERTMNKDYERTDERSNDRMNEHRNFDNITAEQILLGRTNGRTIGRTNEP